MSCDLMRGAVRWIVVWAATSSLAATGEAGPPADPVGSWKLSYVCPDGRARDCVIVVARDGSGLKATCKGSSGTRPARSVAFDGRVLTVRVDGDFAGSRYDVTYRGRVVGDTLRGDVRWSYLWASGSFAFEGERVAER